MTMIFGEEEQWGEVIKLCLPSNNQRSESITIFHFFSNRNIFCFLLIFCVCCSSLYTPLPLFFFLQFTFMSGALANLKTTYERTKSKILSKGDADVDDILSTFFFCDYSVLDLFLILIVFYLFIQILISTKLLKS